MPFLITVPNLRDGYAKIAKWVVFQGEESAPRGMATRELLDVIIELTDPTDALPIDVGRGVVPAIGVLEAAQLIGSVSTPDLAVRVAPNMAQFMDGKRFHGAYGERIGAQMLHVERKLKSDADCRQAVVNLWDHRLDNWEGMKDYPCTIMLQFLLRQDRLLMHTTMRSNDVWWGLAYDAFQFTQLQLSLARALDVEPGSYHHHAVSLHAYARDFDAIENLRTDVRDATLKYFGVGRLGDDMNTIIHRARALAENAQRLDVDRLYAVDAPTSTELEYARALA